MTPTNISDRIGETGDALHRPNAGSAAVQGRPKSRETVSEPLRDDLAQILREHSFSYLVERSHGAAFEFGASAAGAQPRLKQMSRAQDSKAYHATKRLFDILIASIGILLLTPVIIMLCLAILIEDGAPIVYYQARTGRGGRSFRFFKFRSMVRNADAVKAQLQKQNEADGPIFKMKNDPRVTRVGRFIRRTSLDELPQLINVLRGEMSVIGPRPLYTPEADKLDERFARRHEVQPGLLCLREVCGRSELTFDQWMELDLVYVKTHSLRTDLTIMLRAIPAILSSNGAY
jgi:lipopolysaccharide/colanic/teichoic acid biosynthesis glycosyltransferase